MLIKKYFQMTFEEVFNLTEIQMIILLNQINQEIEKTKEQYDSDENYVDKEVEDFLDMI